MSESSNFVNGKPIIPVLNERTLPKFMESAREAKTVSRNSNRLKLFSGRANPTLSQVIIIICVLFYIGILSEWVKITVGICVNF